MAAHTALCGGDRALVERVFDAPTTDGGVELLEEAGLKEAVIDSLEAALDRRLKARAGADMEIEALFFSNRFGILGQTPGAARLLARHRTEYNDRT